MATYTKTELIEELKDIASKKGRTPKQSDLIMESSVSSQTFNKHFGSWSNAIEEFEMESGVDVFLEQPEKVDGAKYVYAIRGSDKMVKIGITTDLDKRFRQLQNSSPVELEVFRSIYIHSAPEVESAFHTMFKEWHSHGEWFELNRDGFERLENEFAKLSELGRD